MVYKHPIAGKQTTTSLLTKKWLPFLDLFFKSICRRNFLNTMCIESVSQFMTSLSQPKLLKLFLKPHGRRFQLGVQSGPEWTFSLPGVTKNKNLSPRYHTVTSKEVIKRKENVILGILFDLTPNSLSQNSKKWREHSIENCYFDLGSERVYWFWITLLCDLSKRSLHFPSK